MRLLILTLEFSIAAFSGNGIYAQSQVLACTCALRLRRHDTSSPSPFTHPPWRGSDAGRSPQVRALRALGHRVLVVCGCPAKGDAAAAVSGPTSAQPEDQHTVPRTKRLPAFSCALTLTLGYAWVFGVTASVGRQIAASPARAHGNRCLADCPELSASSPSSPVLACSITGGHRGAARITSTVRCVAGAAAKVGQAGPQQRLAGVCRRCGLSNGRGRRRCVPTAGADLMQRLRARTRPVRHPAAGVCRIPHRPLHAAFCTESASMSLTKPPLPLVRWNLARDSASDNMTAMPVHAGCDRRRLALAAGVRGTQRCAAEGPPCCAAVCVHELQV